MYKWYNLVIFTASVQEYADPVIDWLEQDRKFFSQRYYRQHCTFRHGAYIKDLGNTPGHLNHWSRKAFVALLSQHGTVEEIRSPFPWTMLLARV